MSHSRSLPSFAVDESVRKRTKKQKKLLIIFVRLIKDEPIIPILSGLQKCGGEYKRTIVFSCLFPSFLFVYAVEQLTIKEGNEMKSYTRLVEHGII